VVIVPLILKQIHPVRDQRWPKKTFEVKGLFPTIVRRGSFHLRYGLLFQRPFQQPFDCRGATRKPVPMLKILQPIAEIAIDDEI